MRQHRDRAVSAAWTRGTLFLARAPHSSLSLHELQPPLRSEGQFLQRLFEASRLIGRGCLARQGSTVPAKPCPKVQPRRVPKDSPICWRPFARFCNPPIAVNLEGVYPLGEYSARRDSRPFPQSYNCIRGMGEPETAQSARNLLRIPVLHLLGIERI